MRFFPDSISTVVDFLDVVVCSVVIPLFAGLGNFKKLTAPSKAIFAYVVFSGTCDTILTILTYRGVDSRPGAPFYTVAEFAVLSIFFYRIFTFPKKGNLIVLTAIGFTLLCVVNTLFFQPLAQFNTYTRSAAALIIITYCLTGFNQESKIRQSSRWEKRPLNWMLTGLLTYFAGALSFFLFSNLIATLAIPTQLMIWYLHGVMQILMYILFSIGFLNERGKSSP